MLLVFETAQKKKKKNDSSCRDLLHLVVERDVRPPPHTLPTVRVAVAQQVPPSIIYQQTEL